MAVLQNIPLSQDTIKLRWKEPYVTAALNQKNITVHPKGTLAGWRVVPSAGFVVQISMDPLLNLSVANVLDTTSGKFSVSILQNDNILVDLTAQAATTVFFTIDAQYTIGATSAAQVKVVDAAELIANPDLVVIAKVNVPGIAPVLATHINMGYRTVAGDSNPPEAAPHFNLIGNPTFESATIAGWAQSGFDTATASTDTSHTGAYSLKLTKAVAGSPTITSGAMPVTPSRLYRVGGWLASTGGAPITGGNGAKLQLLFFDASNAPIGAPIDIEAAFSGGGTTFVERRTEVAAPMLAYYARVRIFYDNCSGTLYVDDVEFSSHFGDALAMSPVFGGPTTVADSYHTHSSFVGLLIGVGGIASAGDISLNASNKVVWPDFDLRQVAPNVFDLFNPNFFGGTGQSPFSFRLDTAGDAAQLYTRDGFTDGFVGLSAGGSWSAPYAGMGIGTANPTPLSLMTNNVLRWQVLSTGELQAQGGNRAVQNVLNPVTAQDAATKAYVDANSGVGRNALINGGFRYWERAPTHLFAGVTVSGYNFLGYTSDRWYAQIRDDGGGGNTIAVDYRRITVPPPPTTSGLLSTNRVAQINNQDPGSGLFYQLVQEVDRETVIRLRGKKVSWRVAVRRGATAPGNTDFFIESLTGTGASTQRLAAYTGAALLFSGGLGGGGISTTVFTYLTGTSAGVVDVNATTMAIYVGAYNNGGGPGDATDYMQFGEVEIVEGDAPPTDFDWAAGDVTGELYLCQRYYEKSSRTDFGVPISGSADRAISACLGFPAITATIANGSPWNLSHPRFRVTKRATPSVRIWTTASVANQWDLPSGEGLTGGDAQASAVGNAGPNGFEILNNTGGGYLPLGAGNAIGQWDADAEI